MQYSYGWEKLYETVRTLTLLDEASVRERLSVAWETFARLHGGEPNLPEDLDERYHDIFDRIRTHDRIADLEESEVNAITGDILDLYAETERRGYGLEAKVDEE